MNKKILIITPGFLPLLGGMEEQVYLLGKEFIRLGYKVTVLTERTKPEFSPHESIDGISVERVGRFNSRIVSFPIIFYSYVKHLLHHKYDLIIVRTFTFPAVVTGFLKKLGLIGCKTVITAETGGKNDDIEAIAKMPFSGVIYFLIKGNDYFNCLCEDNYKHLKKHNFPKNRITRIYNGISFKGYKNRVYPNKVENFLFLGQLRKEKGIWELVNAVKKLVAEGREIRLFIGGDGEEKRPLERFIKSNHLEKNIIYQGRISREEKDKFFSQGECLVLPSYSEGFPLVVIEAVKYKKLVLVTNVSDVNKLFGSRALYCDKKSVTSLKMKMLEAISFKPVIGFNYDDIREQCDIKNTAKQFLKFISL